ncbi:MAG TPA: hypothetical protein VFS96_06605 [Nitrolancea sp.]|nr:hypothetical protein [Nitrolancea sp.]
MRDTVFEPLNITAIRNVARYCGVRIFILRPRGAGRAALGRCIQV